MITVARIIAAKTTRNSVVIGDAEHSGESGGGYYFGCSFGVGYLLLEGAENIPAVAIPRILDRVVANFLADLLS